MIDKTTKLHKKVQKQNLSSQMPKPTAAQLSLLLFFRNPALMATK